MGVEHGHSRSSEVGSRSYRRGVPDDVALGAASEHRAGVGVAMSDRVACAQGGNDIEVAERLGVNRTTVGKWRRRFIDRRLDGLHDEPRPGAPRSIGDDDVERVLVKTLETTPRDATHWSTRSMAASTGLTQSAISRIWRAFGLKPHLVDTFKLSPDPLFIEKVRDIVGLYVNPPDAAVVLSG